MSQIKIDRIEADKPAIELSLDVGLYPIEVLYGAAYVFIDRCFVLLDREGGPDGPASSRGAGRFVVRLRGKNAMTDAQLQDLLGEFGNELLSQALRRKIVKQNQKIIEEITTQAIAGAAGGTLPTDFLDAGDDGMDFLDDPLGIAVPWEEKFKKKKETTEPA